jgi:hypothetical protein
MAFGARRIPEDGIHTVRAGETISSIGATYGITNWEEHIWNAPQNATLKQQRINPNTLAPGDNVFIPPRQSRQEARDTDAWHDFHVVRNKRMLRLKIENEHSEPLAGKAYEIRALSTFRGTYVQQNQTTDADGYIREMIPHTMTEADLIIEEAKIHVRLKIGHLLPLPGGDPIKLEIAGTDVGGAMDNISAEGDGALGASGSLGGMGGPTGGAADVWGSIKGAAQDVFNTVAPAISAAAPLVNAVASFLGEGNLIESRDASIPGAAQRLDSMGYDCGKPTSGEPDSQFTAALIEFQAWCKQNGAMSQDAGGLLGGVTSNPLAQAALGAVGLTGNLDEETIEALKKVHGC